MLVWLKIFFRERNYIKFNSVKEEPYVEHTRSRLFVYWLDRSRVVNEQRKATWTNTATWMARTLYHTWARSRAFVMVSVCHTVNHFVKIWIVFRHVIFHIALLPSCIIFLSLRPRSYLPYPPLFHSDSIIFYYTCIIKVEKAKSDRGTYREQRRAEMEV